MFVQVMFVFIDLDEEDNMRVLEFFGLGMEDAPTYRIINLDEEVSVLILYIKMKIVCLCVCVFVRTLNSLNTLNSLGFKKQYFKF